MSIYISIKQKLINPFLSVRTKLLRFNMAANAKNQGREFVRKFNFDKLNKEEIKIAKAYWKSKGFKLDNTIWHQYYKGATGNFVKEYVPHDIFSSHIAPSLNQKIQWPALLDKNLSYNLFKGYKQPKLVISNINGFYFHNGEIISELEAVQICSKSSSKLVVKPSIESGGGFMVNVLSIQDIVEEEIVEHIINMFKSYNRDFVVQEFVEQSPVMAKLNKSSLNTLRIMSYLNNGGVHIVSSVLRIGNAGKSTDNFATGGVACGVKNTGRLKEIGFIQDGTTLTKTTSGIVLKEVLIPNYNNVLKMVELLHKRVPYFRIISWDIGIDKNNDAILIEYNTYNQSTKIHQIVNGPLFGTFTNEILAEARK